MKYGSLLILWLLPLLSFAGDGFVIRGKITGVANGSVTILDLSGGSIADFPRVRIENGEFTYSGKLDHPQLLQLKVSTRKIEVFLENADYTINCSFDSLSGSSLKGGKYNDHWQQYRASKVLPMQYFAEHPQAEIAAWIANRYAVKYDEAKAAYAQLTAEGKSSPEGKALAERIGTYRMIEARSPLPEFRTEDPAGKTVSLSDLKGKVVVLDFWASWCAPCRAYVPTLREHYNRYKDKGVTFVGVSVDEDKGKWKKAMEELQMEWMQVLADGGFKEETGVRKLFNITGIPHLVIVDKDGRIATSMDFYQRSHFDEVVQKLLQ
ncbi:AhpC/TSA family protein [Chitinophaga oryzae]|uniref:AhpC/TSA family protein n=1 Tax=Chitinophaga oryzae TaxID=2725414 RepID=A0AAE7D705_9BACT|nr:TlpA disulfide reductase family protein [Chitinophaga oryzae]QJB31847.1 AhpC/TSA family protein [Chitinophaga oryzae]